MSSFCSRRPSDGHSLKDDAIMQSASASASAHTLEKDEPEQQQRCIDDKASSVDNKVSTSRHYWGDGLMDAGIKIAKTTGLCNILSFGNKGRREVEATSNNDNPTTSDNHNEGGKKQVAAMQQKHSSSSIDSDGRREQVTLHDQKCTMDANAEEEAVDDAKEEEGQEIVATPDMFDLRGEDANDLVGSEQRFNIMLGGTNNGGNKPSSESHGHGTSQSDDTTSSNQKPNAVTNNTGDILLPSEGRKNGSNLSESHDHGTTSSHSYSVDHTASPRQVTPTRTSGGSDAVEADNAASTKNAHVLDLTGEDSESEEGASEMREETDLRIGREDDHDCKPSARGDDILHSEDIADHTSQTAAAAAAAATANVGSNINPEHSTIGDEKAAIATAADVVDLSIDDSDDEVTELFSMFTGNHHNVECTICNVGGGDLICCDYCEREYHFQCHAPPITSVPSLKWKCNECSTAPCNPSLPLPEKRRERFRQHLCRYNLRVRSKRDTPLQSSSEPSGNEMGSTMTSASSCRRGAQKEKELFNGEHLNECYLCDAGGNLILCDYCSKSFHPRCHIPPLTKIPPVDQYWKCCECRAPELVRRYKCGECHACLRKECKRCRYCRDMIKFGGHGILKQACVEKRCPNKRYALPANNFAVVASSSAVVGPVISTQREPDVLQDNGEVDDDDDDDDSSIQRATNVCHQDDENESYQEEEGFYYPSDEADEESDSNENECFICEDGGDLVLCDYCEKSFHMKCHIPRLDKTPAGKWKCCECIAVKMTELSICGECDECLQPNCGECGPCLDKEILGMMNVDACELKRCRFMRYAPPEEVASEAESEAGVINKHTKKLNKRNGKSRRRPNSRKQNKKRTKRRKRARRKTNRSTRQVGNENIVQSPFKSPTDTSPNDPSLGGLKVISVTLGSEENKPNGFEEFFKNRTFEVKIAINKSPPPRSWRNDGRVLELVSAKLPRENRGMFSVKEMKLKYIAIEIEDGHNNNNLPKINLQTELDKLCSFSSLGAVKACSRLSQLQAEAKHICFTTAAKIEYIDENGNEGCGFFPRGFFDGSGPRRKYDSIQVRVIGPNIGLAKGMLLVKDGISKIQLPQSMIKAPPSKTSDETWVAIIMKNVFPCEKNIQLGRYLHPDDDACNSWKKQKHKELSEMYQRMLLGFGVKEEYVSSYTELSRSSDRLKHAHLKGVADPTFKIPGDKVFISGYTSNSNGEMELFGKCFKQIYCSRSPAVSPGDAKILSVVGDKTEDMSDEEWALLCSYRWGTIIFGAPHDRLPAPLPNIIADGDLDGDDYFVCWDDNIVGHLLHAKDKLTSKSRKLLFELKLPEKTEHSVDKTNSFSQGGDDWLSLAQDKMLDFATQNSESHITGKLYTLCTKASKKSGGKIDIYDEDACAYAQAFKDALDIQKHGGKIFLPKKLHDSIPPSLRFLLL